MAAVEDATAAVADATAAMGDMKVDEGKVRPPTTTNCPK
jgi:hypothetical protein